MDLLALTMLLRAWKCRACAVSSQLGSLITVTFVATPGWVKIDTAVTTGNTGATGSPFDDSISVK